MMSRETIRTLTSILYKLNREKSPSKRSKDVLPFLQHFTTLLTCSDRDNPQVIAVTGSISPGNQVKTLIVAQNPQSRVETISLESVKKDEKTLAEVVNGPPNASLLDHVADVWSALFAFDRTAKNIDLENQLVALHLFFLSRSYREFSVRFRQDSTLCGGRRLHDIILEWQPDPSHIEISPKWVAPPGWLLDFQDLPKIKSRTVQGRIEWEFSDETKQAWSRILAILLIGVDEALVGTKDIRSKSKVTAEQVREAMLNLEHWCRGLWYFVRWEEGIVKTLLIKTNLVESITAKFKLMASASASDTDGDDDATQFRQEPGESKGQQVYRYLKTVVAWHDAAHYLATNSTFPTLLENIEIGLVEVPRSSSSVLSLDQVSSKLVMEFPDIADLREDVEAVLKPCYSDKFSGCIHAEATLMGLLNYYGHELMSANPVMDAQRMRDIIEPVAAAGNAVIAVSKKCCWCCDWLGLHLEMEFRLPGTHGIMYPWDPPMVGISTSVLMGLEKELWKELHDVVLCAISPGYSRQSSTVGSPSGLITGTMFSHRAFKLKTPNLDV